MTIDPRGMDVIEWTDFQNLSLGTYGTVPHLQRAEKWRDWAVAVNLLPGVAAFSPPNPYEFEEWHDWAFRFNETVKLPG